MRDDRSTPGRWRGFRQADGFYGWWMVALCAVVSAMTAPGQTIGVSVFIDPFMEALDLTRTQISTAYMIGTLTSAATMPRVGTLVDRFGSRLSMVLTGGLFGVVLCGMAGIRGLIGLVVGFTAIRLLGQGALSLVASNAVAPWFERRRGLAMGVSTAIGASLISLVPIGSAALIERFGWRTTWLLLGATVWLVVLPAAFRGIVNHPRELGQLPDGDAPTPDRAAEGERTAAMAYQRREALATPMYWAIAASTTASSALVTGMNFHQIDLLGEQGLSRIEAAANFLPQTAGTLLATLAVGALVDRVAHRWLILTTMTILASAMLMVPFAAPGFAAMTYGLVLGSASGANRILEAGATPRLFGLTHLGSIRGATRLIGVMSSAVGPLLLSSGRDLAGGYAAVLRWLVIIPLAVSVLALVSPTPDPVPPSQRPD